MIDPSNVPEISTSEVFARYILQKSHVRADRSVKPNVFMPPPNLELSVTRHLSASDDELWLIGGNVAKVRALTLYGRGDVDAKVLSGQSLSMRPDPIIPSNPNHAIVYDWPEDKPTQKNIAQEIAAMTRYVPQP